MICQRSVYTSLTQLFLQQMPGFDVLKLNIHYNGDNHFQICHLGRYFVEYTFEIMFYGSTYASL